MSSGKFVNLHNHSEYSLLDGYSHIDEYVRRAHDIGQDSFALTDHGNLYGAIELIQTCNALAKDVDSKDRPQTPIHVKPIVGIEAYAAPENPLGAKCKDRIHYGESWQRSDDVSANGHYLHLTLLARTNEGLHNLIKLSTESFRPENAINHIGRAIGRIDMAMLQKYSTGLIATTGCPSGEILTRLRLGQKDKAYEYAERMKDLFPDSYYVEVMDHHMQSDLERKMLPELVKMAKELDLPLLATNDAHYASPDDALHHEELCCTQSKSNMDEPTYAQGGKRFAFDGHGYYIKSYDEMIETFPEDEFPGAVSNSVLIADSVEEYDIAKKTGLRPVVDIPDGYTERTWFQKRINDGFQNKRLDAHASPEVLIEAKKRIAKEYPVFAENDFIQYMLVVQDYINWARENGIRVGKGRGSVGGSEIAYDMNISDTDPIRHDLIFERFLNPERLSPPDVDTDFEAARRDEVLTYVKQKYGADHISNVVVFQKFQSRQGFKDMARIYGLSFAESNRIANLIPKDKGATFAGMFNPNDPFYAKGSELRDALDKPGMETIRDAAKALEGRVKTISTHACAVIMCNQDIYNWCPMQWDMSKDKKVWGDSITQWPYEQCEALGLIKMDFLSLADLNVVEHTIENIKYTTGKEIDEEDILNGDLSDKKTYQLLSEGRTSGVFQISSDGFHDLMIRMKPDRFDDIAAALALYRPGPMDMGAHIDYADGKNGRKKVEVFDKGFIGSPLETILSPTFQKIVYQEQVMQISVQIAGFTLGQADSLRSAMGHKKPELMAKMKSKFMEGCLEHHYPLPSIEELWGYIEKFSAYAFNKAHSASYGLTTYETAYFKAHYPVEFMSAVLTNKNAKSSQKNKKEVPLLLRECAKMGIKVSGVDINKSYGSVMPTKKTKDTDPDIVYGFNAINGISAWVGQSIVQAREDNGGSFKDFDDFMTAIPKDIINKTVIESLAKAGAFDSFGIPRRSVFVSAVDIVSFYKDKADNAAHGQGSLFDMLPSSNTLSKFVLPDITDWTFLEKLAFEKEMLGIYVSATPLSNVGVGLDYLKASYMDIPVSDIEQLEKYSGRGHFRTIATLNDTEIKHTKKGDSYAKGIIDDGTSSMPFMIFSKDMASIMNKVGVLKSDAVYVITGSYFNSFRDDSTTFSIESLDTIDLTVDGRIPLWLRFTDKEKNSKGFSRTLEVLKKNPGSLPVFFSIQQDDGSITTEVPGIDISDTQESIIEIERTIGNKRFGKWNESVQQE
jgi:DNA polymerase-3 subunit alpha